MRVIEQYDSVQGTGRLTGIRQHFVRLAGCTVRCPIRSVCDEPQALDPRGGEDRTVDEIVARAGKAEWIHISGGEPLQQLPEVARLIGRRQTHLQTSGLIDEGDAMFGFVTCSPKAPADAMKLRWCNELVVVAATWVSPATLVGFARRYPHADRWVMPLWGDTTDRCQQLMQAEPTWRMTSQAHKTWGVK